VVVISFPYLSTSLEKKEKRKKKGEKKREEGKGRKLTSALFVQPLHHFPTRERRKGKRKKKK